MDFMEHGKITSDGCFLTTMDDLNKLGINKNHIEHMIHIGDNTVLIPSIDILFRMKNSF